jgi:hypothetical protein
MSYYKQTNPKSAIIHKLYIPIILAFFPLKDLTSDSLDFSNVSSTLKQLKNGDITKR